MNIKKTDKDYKGRTVENYQTKANRNSDKKKKMEMYRTHITYRNWRNRENCSNKTPNQMQHSVVKLYCLVA
jgi:hypothetical protein